MTETERNIHRAAILAILMKLDDDRLLEGISDIQLGKLLDCNRTTAWRYRQALPAVREELKRLKERIESDTKI